MTITGFTPLNTNHCLLNESRIDLWQFSLEADFSAASTILNDEEKARAARFYFERHRRRFATARAMTRIILSRYLNASPDRLEFTYGFHGKPEITNSQRLQFNISHSGDLALLAVGKNYPLGVDIEFFSSRPYEGIANNLFSEQEINDLKKAPATLKPALFFHIWAQKEAFIKASGLGLSYPTKSFNVPTVIPTKQLVDDPLHNLTWQLRSFMPKVGCSGALCYHPSIREIRHGLIEIHQQVGLRF